LLDQSESKKVNQGETCLQHFHTDQGIECFLELGWNFTVIHEVNSDVSLQASFSDAIFRKLLLFNGQSQSIDFASKITSSLGR
jgi:hypothetical protein